jgi:glycolate oxidase FAD binding subunit
VAELSNLVLEAANKGLALYPVGGQTMLGHGLPPTRPGVAVATQGLAKLIDYPARDMTVTLQAGIRIADAQKLFATENQRLPIDVPRADCATVGGILATNSSGPRRYGFGTLRDYIIGISVINDAGQEVKAGGRVVKNVAGYDLCKLHIGALGTLGLIMEVTLKLRPRPEEQALVVLPCSDNGLESLLEQLARTATRPIVMDLVNLAAMQALNREYRTALPDGPWVVLVGFEDNQGSLEWQVQQLVKELRFNYALEVRVGCAATPLWQALVEFSAQPGSAMTFKSAVLPSTTATFCRHAAAFADELLLQAHAGNGLVIGHTGPDLTRERAAAMLNLLREMAGACAGHVTVLCCPPAWKDPAFVWGRPRADAWLMRKVKEQLDPRRVFNPGRFVDGI